MFYKSIYKTMTIGWDIVILLKVCSNRSDEQIKKYCDVYKFYFHPFYCK